MASGKQGGGRHRPRIEALVERIRADMAKDDHLAATKRVRDLTDAQRAEVAEALRHRADALWREWDWMTRFNAGWVLDQSWYEVQRREIERLNAQLAAAEAAIADGTAQWTTVHPEHPSGMLGRLRRRLDGLKRNDVVIRVPDDTAPFEDPSLWGRRSWNKPAERWLPQGAEPAGTCQHCGMTLYRIARGALTDAALCYAENDKWQLVGGLYHPPTWYRWDPEYAQTAIANGMPVGRTIRVTVSDDALEEEGYRAGDVVVVAQDVKAGQGDIVYAEALVACGTPRRYRRIATIGELRRRRHGDFLYRGRRNHWADVRAYLGKVILNEREHLEQLTNAALVTAGRLREKHGDDALYARHVERAGALRVAYLTDPTEEAYTRARDALRALQWELHDVLHPISDSAPKGE